MVENLEGVPLDVSFTEQLTGDMGPNKWTVVVLPESATRLGTPKPVKVSGTIDAHVFEATLLPLGQGTHMLRLNAKLKKLVGKAAGAEVSVHLDRRFS